MDTLPPLFTRDLREGQEVKIVKSSPEERRITVLKHYDNNTSSNFCENVLGRHVYTISVNV